MIDVIDYTQHEGELPETCAVINMPNEAYHNHPSISKSGLDLINRSIAHYEYRTPFETTRHMEIGTAIHAALFEHDRYKKDYTILPNVKARTASEYKQAVKATGTSETVLIGHESDKVNGMYQSVSLNSDAMQLLSDGYPELSVFAVCSTTGLPVRCRFDFLTKGGQAVDLKKTQDIRYEKFQRSIGSYRYHVQDAFYTYVAALAGITVSSFHFLAVEEQPPHANKLYTLDDEAKAVGEREFKKDLEAYEVFKSFGGMPYGLVQDNELMSLPVWALDDEADAEYQL
jgi:hypothetical protein